MKNGIEAMITDITATTAEAEDYTGEDGLLYCGKCHTPKERELKERAAAIQAELSKAQEATVNAEKFMNVVRRHTSFEELTPTLLREFVEKIVVHECSYDENKTRRQDLEIYYSFVGKVDLPE